jgi:hypothetical protein
MLAIRRGMVSEPGKEYFIDSEVVLDAVRF